MDVQMPRMDGLEAVRRLRAGACGERAARVPVVALTAYAMSGDRDRFLDAGMTDYLAKPLRLEALLEAVARHRGAAFLEGAPPSAPAPAFDQGMLAATAAYLRERTGQARDHLAQGDYEQAARAAHDVKGTSMVFRFASVNEAGARLFEAAKGGDREAAAAALGLLMDALREIEGATAPSEAAGQTPDRATDGG